jgi:hypothetical protein
LIWVKVFSIIHDYLSITSANEPFVVRLKEWHIERVDLSVHGSELLDLECKRLPLLNVYQYNLAILGCSKDMVSTWKNFEWDYIIHNFTALLSCIDLATAKSPSFIIDFEESDKSICEGSNHVRFELMHSDGTALFFGNDELKHELTIKHVPALYHSISTRGSYQVILIKLMKFTSFFNLELSWGKIFVVGRCYSELRRMTRFNLDCSLL